MKKQLHRAIASSAVFLFLIFAGSPVPIDAQEMRMNAKTSIGVGWHPWYEIKADPEDPKNLIICGTKWDALAMPRSGSFMRRLTSVQLGIQSLRTGVVVG